LTQSRIQVPENPIPLVPFPVGYHRLGARLARYFLWSFRRRHFGGALDAVRGALELGGAAARSLLRPERVACNLCGWRGASFCPNVGSGYRELGEICPSCGSIGRYRALVAILDVATPYFSPETPVIEVAPMPISEAYSLWRKDGRGYTSFDRGPYAMERGDLTEMRFADGACELFVCLHVLEHISSDGRALREIHRVLRPGGRAVLQVPIDRSIEETVEYGGPNELETGHVRRYSERGFVRRIEEAGFQVSKVSVGDLFDERDIALHGLHRDPYHLALKLDHPPRLSCARPASS
jgi:hypothetical protein